MTKYLGLYIVNKRHGYLKEYISVKRFIEGIKEHSVMKYGRDYYVTLICPKSYRFIYEVNNK